MLRTYQHLSNSMLFLSKQHAKATTKRRMIECANYERKLYWQDAIQNTIHPSTPIQFEAQTLLPLVFRLINRISGLYKSKSIMII